MAEPLTARAPDRRQLALAVLCLSLIVVVVDNTILNVALPTLVRDLRASTSQLQWIVDSYVLVFAGLLLTAGSLGDRFGRRGALTSGLLVFAAGSVAAALASTPTQLIAMRAVMGLGAAFVFPATLSILTNIFTEPAERARAIAVWAGTAALGIAIGPVTGGWLLEHFWWGSIFLVNLPIVAIALVGGRFLVPTSKDPASLPLDWPGAALSVVSVVALVFAIIQAPDRGWTSGAILGAFAVAGAGLASFILRERRTPWPLVDLSIFRNPRFSAASAAVTFVYFCLLGTLFFLTQHLQFLLGYNPLEAGIAVLPFAIVLLPVTNLTPRLVARWGAKRVVTTGLLAVAASLLLRSTATVDSGYDLLLFSSILMALGMGLTIAPSTASIMAAVPRSKAGVGSAINDTTRQLGGALGVAVLGSLLSSTYRSSFGSAVAGEGLPASAVAAGRAGVGSALDAARSLSGPLGSQVETAARHAFVHAADVACVVGAVVALVGAAVVARFLPGAPALAPVAVVEEDVPLIVAVEEVA